VPKHIHVKVFRRHTVLAFGVATALQSAAARLRHMSVCKVLSALVVFRGQRCAPVFGVRFFEIQGSTEALLVSSIKVVIKLDVNWADSVVIAVTAINWGCCRHARGAKLGTVWPLVCFTLLLCADGNFAIYNRAGIAAVVPTRASGWNRYRCSVTAILRVPKHIHVKVFRRHTVLAFGVATALQSAAARLRHMSVCKVLSALVVFRGQRCAPVFGVRFFEIQGSTEALLVSSIKVVIKLDAA